MSTNVAIHEETIRENHSSGVIGGRLLVVDDEPLNLEIISEYLEDESYSVTTARDGSEALQLLNSNPTGFDCVILDRMMPRIDGMEVLRRMKAESRFEDIPVIMQTAAASRDQVAEGLRLGAYYYLSKPYHQDALRVVVRSALGAARMRGDMQRRIDEYTGVLGLLVEGKFTFKTLTQARSLAAAVASACANPSGAGMGLVEILVNAVEHGNLGIDFHQKSTLLSEGRWDREIEARQALPEFNAKKVTVEISRSGGELHIIVTDEGPGFDWERYLELDEARALHPNGRGIALAKGVAFRHLEYRGAGNIVSLVIEASA
jgi:CheY-like chemotaxis protein